MATIHSRQCDNGEVGIEIYQCASTLGHYILLSHKGSHQMRQLEKQPHPYVIP
ncbi:unnamed protein product [Periconia digitata]|uniref:Uncharacterized protein n=1 Tax=Periconia digitata TaxID=1303443 RepID=A0A9W4UJB8_9PLEO|nr:unnamed protein product [Periconia digitata]